MTYEVYSPEVRRPVEVSGDQKQHLVAWLTKRLASEIRAPELDGLGFLLVGGRLLASDDGPFFYALAGEIGRSGLASHQRLPPY